MNNCKQGFKSSSEIREKLNEKNIDNCYGCQYLKYEKGIMLCMLTYENNLNESYLESEGKVFYEN